ncbi:ABC transporter ATP-binding protein [bacterium]|jgi:NitT/TauT family transport system ATP-binding protein|nr:ABC transporter ATP-binding protein [bacterium]
MLKFKNVSFSYENELFKNFNFEAQVNETTCILGPSGSGKTTLLKLAAGLIKPQSGVVESFTGRASFVFQEEVLLPWFSALKNIELLGVSEKTALEFLKEFGLEEAKDLFPAELSGGMKRRLSIARALAYGGDVFYLDEPAQGLDIKTMEKSLNILKSKIEGKSVLLITHNLEEAFLLADRIVVVGERPLVIKGDFRKSDFKNVDELRKTLEKIL